ncbi:unnamed protein product [Prorocentrum cordatum]|uniref:Uncharacterized protein n=1 Tax=Prorocentrum cordatum TaxID=2364126 RepID=A0ABN9Q2U0_9DINO|nr:unnamed protein product [Polarella glacialis]
MMANSPGPRLAHLMKMALDEFSLLEARFPGDLDQAVGLLLNGARYKDCAIQNAVNAVQHVVKGGAQESLVNPVVRGLGALHVRLDELQAKGPMDRVGPGKGPLENHEGRDRSQEQRSKFMASIFAEVASLQLGAVGFASKERDYTGIPSKMLQEVRAMAISAAPLVTPDMPAHALASCRRRVVEELEAKKKPQQELAKETAGKPKLGAIEAAKPDGAPASGGSGVDRRRRPSRARPGVARQQTGRRQSRSLRSPRRNTRRSRKSSLWATSR